MLDISKAVQKALDSKGVSQYALANKVGWSSANVNHICRGRAGTNIRTLQVVAEALEMKLSELIALGEDE